MSGYYDDDEPRRRSHRSRRPVYEEDVVETRKARSSGRQQMDLIRRRDSSSESVEEVRRDFPPGGGEYVQRRKYHRDEYPAQRSRSMDRHSHAYSNGYDNRSSRRDRGRHDRYDSDSESRSPSPRPRERRKSLGEQALAALGLGGAAAALANRGKNKDRDDHDGRARSRSRGRSHRDDSRSPSRSRSRGKETASWMQAAKAAAVAGAVEAVRSRNLPGGWPARGKRVFTAAAGAAGIDKAIDRDPDKHSTMNTLQSALGGLAGNRLINGSRSRSRSRHRGEKDKKSGPGIGDLASGAALASLAWKAYTSHRDKDKEENERGRSRSRGYESDDDPRPKRSKSLSDRLRDGIDKGLAKFGLGDSEYHHDHYYKDQDGSRPNAKYHPSELPPVGNPGLRGGELTEGDEKGHGTDTDSYSSEEEIGKQKKMYRKELITAGLATVATIHAAHSVYQSMEKREARHKKVMEGKMTPEEARKLKSRALLQDAASVGIAALGIKGAVSEWKEMKEQRQEYKESCHRLAEKREHRRKKIEAGEWAPHSRKNSLSSRQSEPDMNNRYSQDGYNSSYYGSNGYQSGNPYASGAIPDSARY